MKARGGVLATEADVIGGHLSSETQSSILRHQADEERRRSLKADSNDARLRKEREAFEKRMRKASGQDRHLTTAVAEFHLSSAPKKKKKNREDGGEGLVAPRKHHSVV